MRWSVAVAFCAVIGILGAEWTALAMGQAPPSHRDTWANAATGVRFSVDSAKALHSDEISLMDGSMAIGKALEWADQILLWRADGRLSSYPLDEVKSFRFLRDERQASRPELPDLTVAYVERLPRDPHWCGRIKLEDGLPVLEGDAAESSRRVKAGEPVQFRVHVLNAGGANSSATTGRVLVDGQVVAKVDVPPLKPGDESVAEASWKWQDGPHLLRVEIDAAAGQPEIANWNNTLEEPIQGQAVTVVVAKDRYESFRSNANMLDTYCVEDWVQHHLQLMNALFAASTYPTSPGGVTERVRCDRIVQAWDPGSPEYRQEWETPLRAGGKAEGAAEYAAALVVPSLPFGADPGEAAMRVDWGLLQDLGRQLGLVDLTATDTRLEQCMVRNQFEQYAQLRHLFPWRRTLMCSPGGYPLSEVGAEFLNASAGGPRGVTGDYLYQLPGEIAVELMNNRNGPAAGIRVDGFQLMSEGEQAGTISGIGETDPLFSGETDEKGVLVLPNQAAPEHRSPRGYVLRPNPFGKIALDGSNGLLLLRLREGLNEEFHFLRLYDCNLAWLRGQKQRFVHRIATRFAGPESPPAASHTAVRVKAVKENSPPELQLGWPMPLVHEPGEIDSFRVYKRTSLGGESEKPWTLVNVIRREGLRLPMEDTSDLHYFKEFRYDGPYSLDTFYAVTAVDHAGHESDLSRAPAFIAHGVDVSKFAIDSNYHAYMPTQGGEPGQILGWNGIVGTQPYGLRNRRFPEYHPSRFAGVAVLPDSRAVMTDPENHVLAFYDQGDLADVRPTRSQWPGQPSKEPGEFAEPLDVATDTAGKIYVADTGNNRVQALDANGGFTNMIDGDFAFERPMAVGFGTGLEGHGNLCVTDQDGKRCRVYDVTASPPTLICELPPLLDADRAVVGRDGHVYVGAREVESKQWAIIEYTPEAGSARVEKVNRRVQQQGGEVDRPRGLYLHTAGDGPVLYFVNAFPFAVRSLPIK